MFRKGIALVVMLLFVGMCIIPSTGKIAEEIPHNTFDGSVLLDINGTMGENGWYISPIWISFEYDPEIILEIWLSITKDPEPNWIMYEEPFLFGGERIWVFQYKWLDIWGNGTCSEPIIIKIDYTPPDIEEVEWETFQEPPIFGVWYCKFTCNAVDSTSGMDRVELYVRDGLYEIITGAGPVYEFILPMNVPWGKPVLNFTHYDIAGNSAFDLVNWSDIESYPYSQSYFMFFLRWLERFPILQKIQDVLRLNIR